MFADHAGKELSVSADLFPTFPGDVPSPFELAGLDPSNTLVKLCEDLTMKREIDAN